MVIRRQLFYQYLNTTGYFSTPPNHRVLIIYVQ